MKNAKNADYYEKKRRLLCKKTSIIMQKTLKHEISLFLFHIIIIINLILLDSFQRGFLFCGKACICYITAP